MPTLKEITEEIMIEASTPTSIFRNAEKFMADKYAKEGLKKLNLTFARSVVGMNVTVPVSCRVGRTPDFLQYIRAYVLNCDGKTIEISRNKNVPETLMRFLLNCDGSVLVDGEMNPIVTGCLICESDDAKDPCAVDCVCACGNTSRVPKELIQLLKDVEKYKDAWIAVHSDHFEFSSNLEGVSVVIEYVSNDINELDQCEIHVPEELGECLEYYIKYKLLEGDINLMNQSQYWKKEYKRMRDLELQNSTTLTEMDLKQLFLIK